MQAHTYLLTYLILSKVPTQRRRPHTTFSLPPGPRQKPWKSKAFDFNFIPVLNLDNFNYHHHLTPTSPGHTITTTTTKTTTHHPYTPLITDHRSLIINPFSWEITNSLMSWGFPLSPIINRPRNTSIRSGLANLAGGDSGRSTIRAALIRKDTVAS